MKSVTICLLLLSCSVFLAEATPRRDAGASKRVDRRGCHILDHEVCDEICKRDRNWYGHCQSWDGELFSCKCFQYHSPLDGEICADDYWVKRCNTDCYDRGFPLGGYCYPHPTFREPKGDPRCKCFENVPFSGDY